MLEDLLNKEVLYCCMERKLRGEKSKCMVIGRNRESINKRLKKEEIGKENS